MNNIIMRNIFNKYEVVKYFEGMPMKTLFVGINKFDYHWHTDIEIVFVLQGKIEITIEDEGYQLKKGDIIIINSSTAHAFRILEQTNMIMIVQFDPKLCNMEGNKEIYNFNCNSVKLGEEKQVAINLLRKSMANMGREIYLKRRGYEHYVKSYFHSIIGLLIRQFSTGEINKNQLDKYYIDRMKNILNFINANYDKDISLEVAADYIKMSPSRFSHLFKENVGISFKKYLTLVRIERAKELLKTTDYTILRIANECGVHNESLLYRTFKAHLGVTPNEFRKNSLKEIRKDISSSYIGINNSDILSALCGFLKD